MDKEGKIKWHSQEEEAEIIARNKTTGKEVELNMTPGFASYLTIVEK